MSRLVSVLSLLAGLSLYGQPSQVILPDRGLIEVLAGESFSVTYTYDVTNGDTTLGGFGFAVHYDSTKVELEGFEVLFTPGYFSPATDGVETSEDGDLLTDREFVITFLSFAGNWPGTALPLDLVRLDFRAVTSIENQPSFLRTTSALSARGYEFLGGEAGVGVPGIPEPSVLLVAIGGAAVLLRRRRRDSE